MDKHLVCNILGEMALLLELAGENPFKVRAYANAARLLENVNEDIGALVDEGRLTEIKGIGKNIADHVSEILKTGSLEEHEDLKRMIPQSVIDMLSIAGLGPKRVRFLWRDIGIKTVGELEMACTRHLLAGKPGFGEKMEANILAGIETIKKFAGKRLFAEGAAMAMALLAEIRRWPETIRSEVCGSIRRRKETVADIDILVSTDRPDVVMARFVRLPGVERVVQHGETKSEVILQSGVQCDLRAVSDSEFPFAEHHFTGSKEHNVAMRALAKKAGMKLNEYGLFREGESKSVPCKDEAEIFEALKLSFIEPELRENMGEIEAAAEGGLPKLIEMGDLRGIIHMHTTYTDGRASAAKMAEAALSLGYSWIAITDHSQAVTVAGGMKPEDALRQGMEIDELNAGFSNFRILKGIEVDILADGSLDFDDELLSGFDLVIAAVHSRFSMGEKEMTERIVQAISNPNVDILAHPTGRLLLAREPYAVDMTAVIEAAAEFRTAIEINAHPQRLDLDWRLCKAAKERGVKIAISPDAHAPEALSDAAYGVGIARKGWLEKRDVLNCLEADELLKVLKLGN